MICSFLFLVLTSSTFRPDHAVSLSVKAPWNDTPLFEQILFYLNDFSSQNAKKFLKVVLKNFNEINNSDYLYSQAKELLSPEDFRWMRSEIEVGAYLPRGESFRRMARQISGSNLSDLFVVGKCLKVGSYTCYDREEVRQFTFDVANGLPKSIVYANLHSQNAANIVLDLYDKNSQFILRPISSGKYGINIRGFGIEMRPFKYSMEYGVADDKVIDFTKGIGDLPKDDTVENFDSIPDSNTMFIPGEVTINSLFATFMGSVSKSNYTRVLRDLTNNYPLYIPGLLKQKLSKLGQESVKSIKYIRRTTRPTSTINGRVLPISNPDIFSLFDILNQEKSFRNVMEFLKISETVQNNISGLQLDSSDSVLFDTRSKFLRTYNDIETDPNTVNWPKSVPRGISFSSSIETGFPRRNILKMTSVADVSVTSGLIEFIYAKIFVNRGLPVQYSLIPFWNLDDITSFHTGLMFHHIERTYSVSKAFDFLSEIYSVFAKNYNSSQESVLKAAYRSFSKSHRKLLPYEKIHQLMYDSPELQDMLESNEYVTEMGLERSIFINGNRIGMGAPPQQIEYFLRHEAVQICNLMLDLNIKGSFDVMDLLASTKLVVKKLTPYVHTDNYLSLSLSKFSKEKQIEYINFLSNSNTVYNTPKDKNQDYQTYYILFSNDSNYNKFFLEDFAKKHEFENPSIFFINPEIPQIIRSIFEGIECQNILIVNGRVFENITAQDLDTLKLIDNWNSQFSVRQVSQFFSSNDDIVSSRIMYLSTIINEWRGNSLVRRHLNNSIWNETNSLIHTSPNSSASINWDIIADPFSKDFQRISSIIEYLERKGLVNIRMCLIPPDTLIESATTVSTYYRNALDGDHAVFTMLNDTTTYSAMPDMPMSFMYESMYMSSDFNNILLSQLKPANHEGIYILTDILIQGFCQTDQRGAYRTAAGAELAVVDNHGGKISDTLVMQSSYFQLYAAPGEWEIKLGGSRSQELFTLDKMLVHVHSFSSNYIRVVLNYRPGMEGLQVGNISYKSTANTTRVDVFSVASGALYERLLKIMFLSVRKNTKANVKFWIIKNFLSPTFKATLPIMAEQYNFSFQLVSYKWPEWLRSQHENQRIIWGNKILFLDVIFPIDLDRVIYIDSDQTVRSDLLELMRMDFKGAPYAFTPMCNNKPETEPFRFWKRGYWLDHLRGKPYHISALFAIDLRRFRQMYAGDILRYHYHQLSADPQSLANLDQDLPNYAQHEIPIFSLPQEWLWCETWCSDDTMDKAKTIDLCNNPLSKASKLHIAQTRIKEWPLLDEEAKSITASPDDYRKQFFTD